jgi:hypothetical protein
MFWWILCKDVECVSWWWTRFSGGGVWWIPVQTNSQDNHHSVFCFTIWFLCQRYSVKLVYLTFFLLHSNILLFTEMFQEIAWLRGSQVMYVLVIATVGRSWAISQKVKDLFSNWILFFSKLLYCQLIWLSVILVDLTMSKTYWLINKLYCLIL